jgi:glucose-6-phosphate isomerase
MSSATLTPNSTAQAQLLTERPAWKALEAHCATIRNLHLRQPCAEHPRCNARIDAREKGAMAVTAPQ